MGRKLTLQDFVTAAAQTHGGKYDYSRVVYEGGRRPVEIICPQHGGFNQAPGKHLSGQGCPKCAGRGADWIQRFRDVHGGKYGYSLFEYTGSQAKSKIICPQHGVFEQTPRNHYQGKNGCPKCTGKGVDWVERFQSVHGDVYDYSLVAYVGYQTKVKIVCRQHGVFEQTPDNHYHGKQGCPKCAGARIRNAKQMCIDEFVARADKVHGGKFLYTDKQFDNVLTSKINVFCRQHSQWFTQTPVNHLSGKTGCPKCNNMKSAPEDAIATMLSRFTPIERRNRALLAPRELDIFMPEKALAVEYCGEYWHSHGDEEHEAQYSMNHFRKYQDCKARGIRLLTIFESEWKEHNYAIRRLLRNAVGASRGKLMARKCELRMVEHKEAAAFYDRYHPQGGSGTGAHYGLYWGDKLVACMRFTEGANDRGVNKKREWTLTRYATRITVSGGASRLFSAFLKDKNPRTVKSFSDNRYFDGGMYSALGFDLLEETKPDYMVWHPKLGLLNKPAWQRRNIVTRAREIGRDIEFDHEADPRTERDMTFLLGGRRIYDCGKKKWVWSR